MKSSIEPSQGFNSVVVDEPSMRLLASAGKLATGGKTRAEPPASSTLARTFWRALGLSIVLPALVVVYVFRESLAGNEVVLALAVVLAGLGFYVLSRVIWGVVRIESRIEKIFRGEAKNLPAESESGQIRELAHIINALNHVTAEFRENAAQLEKFIRQFATLAEVTQLTANAPDVEDLLKLVLEKAVMGVHARRGTIMTLREHSPMLDIVSTEGWLPKTSDSIALEISFAERVVKSGEPLLIEDIEKAADIGRKNDSACYRSPSFIIMPLKTKTAVVGVVCLSEKSTGGSFNSHDQQFLTVLLGQIGFAVQNAQLLKRATDAAQNLEKTIQYQKAQIQDAQRQVMQAEKLSALGQLAGGVAHDFNNILQTILVCTRLGQKGLGQKGLAPDETPYHNLEEIRTAAKKAAALTRQLLAFGRRQVLQPVDLDLNQVINDLIKMLHRVIRADIELELELKDNLNTVNVDPRQFEQVLMNLCLNARDAMANGGKITIATNNVVLDDSYCNDHPCATPGDYVVLRVADQGCGMDADTLNQLFDPFYTTKEVGKGTGLGLAMVYGIVQQHNGLIDVSSELGEGSTFKVYLPIVHRPVLELEKQTKHTPLTGTETLLVAEDDDRVRRLNVKILESAGYTVLSAADGHAALEMFEANVDKISMVLLDAVMPKMTGNEVCRRVRAVTPDLPVLICSGYSSDTRDMDFIRDAGLPLLQKPFEPAELLRTVRNTLDGTLDSSRSLEPATHQKIQQQ